MTRMGWLGIVFFFSGFTSLVYQVVWQRVFTLYYGVGPSWISLTVSAYMLGLGLGSLAGGWLAETVSQKLRLYCLIELSLGLFGLFSLPLLKWMGEQTAGSPPNWCFVYIFLFLLVPTTLMGATLPLLCKVGSSWQPDLIRVVARLYFWNTFGAAWGSLLASFVLISFWGLDSAISIAAVTNFLLAIAVWLMGRTAREVAEPLAPHSDVSFESFWWRRYLPFLVFFSGFLAIGYEIVWFRLIAVLVKDSPYAFSSLLFVYLLGLALGSYVMSSRLPPHWPRPELFLKLQILTGVVTLTSVIAYFYLTESTPFGWLTRTSFSQGRHPNLLGTGGFSQAWSCVDILFWPFFFVFLPSCLLGAGFPLLAHLVRQDQGKEGRDVSRALFLTVCGNVLGGLITGFFLFAQLGSERTLLLFGLTNLSSLMLLERGRLWRRVAVWLACVAAAISVFPSPGKLYILMHRGRKQTLEGKAYFREGLDGVVLTYVSQGDQVLNYVGGQTHGVRPECFFYAEGVEAMALARDPKKVLVIGYGTGSLVETVLKCPDVQHVTLVEINQTLMDNLGEIPLFQDLLKDRRLEIIHDDGRRYLLNSQEQFDLILMDPLRTATAYSNNIYSLEFFQLIASHLKPEACLLVWQDEPRVIPATVRKAFREVLQYSHFLVAAQTPMKANEERREQILGAFPPRLSSEIRELPLKDHAPRPSNEFVNTDYKPISEYYIGLHFLSK